MDIKQLCEVIDQRQEELYDLLCRLIKINSENFSSHGNESECPQYIEELCKELGLETDLYSPLDLEGFADHPDYREGRHLENRLNLTAVWKGKEDVNGLQIMGHHDTVPSATGACGPSNPCWARSATARSGMISTPWPPVCSC